jgi:hypothetical protein
MDFSSSGQDVIERPLILDQNQSRVAEELSDYYELEWTANEIISNNYKRVRTRLFLSTPYPDRILSPGSAAIPR